MHAADQLRPAFLHLDVAPDAQLLLLRQHTIYTKLGPVFCNCNDERFSCTLKIYSSALRVLLVVPGGLRET